jgi:bacterioferritin-associated ferredoxin
MIHDQIQIALAIAEEPTLRSLLTNSTPPIACSQRLGAVRSAIGIPISPQRTLDGLIHYEDIHCVLTDAPVRTDPQLAQPNWGNLPRQGTTDLTRCESEMHTLGQNIAMAQAISLLEHSGFTVEQIDQILNLPQEAWHKTWWHHLDNQGNCATPFLRLIRTLRYTDGTFTIQYKDYFAQDKPLCFQSQQLQVLIEIQPKLQSFSKTLEKINYARMQLGVEKAILICNSLSELELKGFISQGISIYSAEPQAFPVRSNCAVCMTETCPLRGTQDSPVVMCHRFCLEGCIS